MSTDSTILDRLYTRLHGWGHYLCTLFVELPVILRVLLIYGLSRLWGVAVFSMVGRQQLWGPWGERLGYLEFISTKYYPYSNIFSIWLLNFDIFIIFCFNTE